MGAASGHAAARAAIRRSDLTPERVASRFDSDATVAAAVESAGVLEPLAAAGYLPSASASSLFAALDRQVIDFRREPRAGGEAVTPGDLTGSYLLTAAVVDGEVTPQVLAHWTVGDETVAVAVFPEHGDGRVRVQSDDGVETLVAADVTEQGSCPDCQEPPVGSECFDCVYASCLDCTYCSLKSYC